MGYALIQTTREAFPDVLRVAERFGSLVSITPAKDSPRLGLPHLDIVIASDRWPADSGVRRAMLVTHVATEGDRITETIELRFME